MRQDGRLAWRFDVVWCLSLWVPSRKLAASWKVNELLVTNRAVEGEGGGDGVAAAVV